MNYAEFVKYFFDFYGPKGLYPIEGLTRDDVKAGIILRGTKFEGDSFDREAIRDAILCGKGLLGGVAGTGLTPPPKPNE